MAELPATITVTDVTLRDGLQIQPKTLPTEDKRKILEGLLDAGISSVEATSFVHPGMVPQLADAEPLWSQLPADTGVRFTALVPNLRGVQRALAVNCRDLVLVLSASEGHARANTNRTVAESLIAVAEIEELVRAMPDVQLSVAIATSFVCPFDGVTPISQVKMLVTRLAAMGVTHIRLCDTLGKADPRHVTRLVSMARETFPEVTFGLHFHNTYGTGIANVYAGMLAGVTEFDAALGGVGGCPFAPGAAGNIATEDVVHLCERMGVDTGIDLKALAAPAAFLRSAIGGELSSAVAAALRW